MTTSNIEDYIRAAERGKYFEEMVEEKGELPFKNIEGIRVEQRTDLPTSASGSTRKLDKSRDVLHIRIDGVDPKAIYNFSFSVSPMHYYSDSELVAAAKADQGIYTEDGGSNFGVEYSSVEFMDRVRAKRVPMAPAPTRRARPTTTTSITTTSSATRETTCSSWAPPRSSTFSTRSYRRSRR